MGNQKPGFYENTSHSPVDSGKNPVSLVGLRKFGLSDFPEVRQGINSLANSKSRLKPTKILIFSRLQTTFAMRQGFQPLSDYRIIELTEKLTTIAKNLLCAHPIKFNRVQLEKSSSENHTKKLD